MPWPARTSTHASGMMAGLTSPARPWFRLTVADAGLREYGPVKEWLWDVANRMRDMFLKTNLYAVLQELEDRLIAEALERSGGNRKQAAKILGLNRTTLVEKLKKRAASQPPKETEPPEGERK